jgi:hypothetical protein
MTDQSIAFLVAPWLAGGLAGSAFTLISQWIIRFWQRPIINLVFDDKDRGCCILSVTTPRRHHLRVKIINKGRSTARDVSACITKLTLDGSMSGHREFSEEVFDLKLTHRNNVSPFILAPGAHRYFDLAHISEEESSSHFDFDLQPNLPRLPDRGFGMYAGDYGAEIFVAADNAEAQRRAITWEWDGHFDGFKNFRIS